LTARRGVGRTISGVDSHFHKLKSMYGRKLLRTWSSRSLWIWLRLKLNECIVIESKEGINMSAREYGNYSHRTTNAFAFWFIYDGCGYFDFISVCT